MKFRPTGRLLLAFWILVFLGVSAGLWAPAIRWWSVAIVLIGVVAWLDLLFLFSAKDLELTRKLPGRFAQGVAGEVSLRMAHRKKRTLPVTIYDGVPTSGEAENLPWSGEVKSGSFLEISYPVILRERGNVIFTPCHLLWGSPLGFWKRHDLFAGEDSTKVYPNYEPVVRFALLSLAHRQEQMGVVQKNRVGMSREFHQLRDYQEGDALAQIDWKASSKRQNLISRDFQEQRDQTVILMLDTGRRMRAMDGDLSQFDHTLNAMLFLSYVSLRQGDHVGLLGFGGQERWLAPVKGGHAMTTILNHLYDYQSSPVPSDFSDGVERLLARQQRRAMVVVLTNLRGEDGAEMIEPLRLMRKKHLVVLASLREQALDQTLEKKVEVLDDALGYLAVKDYIHERESVLKEIAAHGILTLDETAQNFPVALANRYLKARDAV